MGLLVKWWWRYFKEEGLWKKVVDAIHGPVQGNDMMPAKPNVGGIWKAISGVQRELIESGIDPTTRFNWVEGRGWSWENKGDYISNYVREELDSYLNEAGLENVRWNNWVPKKVNIIVWRAVQSRLPTKVELEKRGIPFNSVVCGECLNHEENVDHVLLGCAKTMEVWSKIGSWCRLSNFYVLSTSDLFSLHESLIGSKVWKKLLNAIIMITSWSLWRARNKKVKEEINWEVDDLVDQVKMLSRLWISNRTSKVDKDWSKWSDFHMV